MGSDTPAPTPPDSEAGADWKAGLDWRRRDRRRIAWARSDTRAPPRSGQYRSGPEIFSRVGKIAEEAVAAVEGGNDNRRSVCETADRPLRLGRLSRRSVPGSRSSTPSLRAGLGGTNS